MIEIISVRFRGGAKNYFFDPQGLQVNAGDHVIVETSQGLAYAKCVEGNHEVNDTAVVQPLRQVVRIATEADRKTDENNRRREKEAFGICEKKILDHKLDMKLVSVECSFEGNKIIFFFTAEGRVDFRELVKDLAGVFRARIELRQIGVRDEAKMLGGLGICGRPLCCNAFLEEFIPVSIKMAKTQNLSLNPVKISGTCGRLMCCLKYEQNAYEDAVKRMPKNDSFVDTPDGIGNVSSVDLLREEVAVRLDSDSNTPKRYKNCEIRVLRNGKGSRDGIEIPKDRPQRYVAPVPEEEAAPRAIRSTLTRDIVPSFPEMESGNEEKQEKNGERGGNRRRGRSSRGRGSETKTRAAAPDTAPKPERSEKAEKSEKAERPQRDHRRRGGEQRKEKAAPRAAEVGEKLTVRSNSTTTADKKAAADRAARAQAAPKPQGEGKAPQKGSEGNKRPHHRRPHHRPRNKGGEGKGE